MGRAKEAMLLEEEGIARQQQEDEQLQWAADEAEAQAEAEAERLQFEAEEKEEFQFNAIERAKAEAAEAVIKVHALMDEIGDEKIGYSAKEKRESEDLENSLNFVDKHTLVQFGMKFYEKAKWLEELKGDI
tara:strand:- start:426 stop:818 length:393 start_codon:yes stop_codon:yes gene_type:complete